MSDRILHDSFSAEYREPFGAVREKTVLRLTVKVPVSCPAKEAFAEIERDDGLVLTVPAKKEEPEAGYVRFSFKFTIYERGIYRYRFRIVKPDGEFRLYREGLHDTNMEAGERWQITCFAEDYAVPRGFCGRMMYQIFPDRFAVGGKVITEGKMKPFRVHRSASEPPDPQPDPDGTWNADFFGGNFRGITEKLDYIAGLGADILYLNPIFKARSNHRYDVADFLECDPMLGTKEDFSALCREAEKRGISVILDGVFSHTGSDSVYFRDAVSDPESPYRKWYEFRRYPDDCVCWWDVKSLPCVNETEPSYLEFITGEGGVIEKWMRLGAAGFRLDVADELPDEFIRAVRRRVKACREDGLLIGEVWEDASNKISYGKRREYFTGGELDGVMNYPFRNAVADFAAGRISAEEFEYAVTAIIENYPRDALFCSTVFLSSHDIPRIRTALGDSLSAFEKAAALQAFLPGIMCVYYGDETGMSGGADPFNRAFFSFPEDGGPFREIYAKYLSLRREEPLLSHGDVSVSADGGILTVSRFDSARRVSLTVDGDRVSIERC